MDFHFPFFGLKVRSEHVARKNDSIKYECGKSISAKFIKLFVRSINSESAPYDPTVSEYRGTCHTV